MLKNYLIFSSEYDHFTGFSVAIVFGVFGFLFGLKISLSIVSSGETNASVAGIAKRTESAHTSMNNWNVFNSSKISTVFVELTTCINGS